MPAAALVGHLWTVGPFARAAILPPTPPPGVPLEVEVADDRHGVVPVRSWLSRRRTDSLLVLIHGLGGSADSAYLVDFAREAFRRGRDVLRFGMRGSDARGDDVYHAGLASDVLATLRAPALAGYREVQLVGFSLGGHLALRVGAEARDPRIHSVVAVGSPLDLDRGAHAIDAPARWPYRRHVLAALKGLSTQLARRGRLGATPEAVSRLTTLRGWDQLVVGPRFGFQSAEDYYARESAAPRLGALPVRSLYVGATHDPMIPRETVEPALRSASAALDVRWEPRAGHVGFPPGLDLGEPGPRGLAAQVLTWLERA